MNFLLAFKEKSFVVIAVILIGFGTINFAANGFAQQTITPEQESLGEEIAFLIIERLLLEVGPIVGGAVMIGINFARKKGLVISAEAEEYFVNSAKSFVADQSRWIYEQMRDNKSHWVDLDGNVKTHEGGMPKSLGREAKSRVKERLLVELKSDEFTKATASLLRENLDSLVERAVTQNNKEVTSNGRKIIFELAPIAVAAALLPFRTKDDIRDRVIDITNTALASIKRRFDFEEIAYDERLAEMVVKAEIQKNIEKQET